MEKEISGSDVVSLDKRETVTILSAENNLQNFYTKSSLITRLEDACKRLKDQIPRGEDISRNSKSTEVIVQGGLREIDGMSAPPSSETRLALAPGSDWWCS